MSAPSGPIATADAIQTLKTIPRLYQRLTLREEIGQRAFNHIQEVPR